MNHLCAHPDCWRTRPSTLRSERPTRDSFVSHSSVPATRKPFERAVWLRCTRSVSQSREAVQSSGKRGAALAY